MSLVKGNVTLDGVNVFDCYLDPADEGWKGWLRPLFTRKQVEALMTDMPGRYDADTGSFVMLFEHCDPEYYEAITIGGVRYWAIGAGCWMWDEATDGGTS